MAAVNGQTTSANGGGYQYPFAAAPDIIRSNQKDVLLQNSLSENLSDVLRNLCGARFVHNHLSETRTLAELLYFGCTTFMGNRTLGEEYCDITQVEDESFKLPTILRRSSYILSTVLLPYVLEKLLPRIRALVGRTLDSKLRRHQLRDDELRSHASLSLRIQSYIRENLSSITSVAPAYALSLSLFYFNGAYYHIGKRLLGLRYIFSRRVDPADQSVGYEVLGFMLMLQMMIQGWLHVRTTLENSNATSGMRQSNAGFSETVTGGAAVDQTSRMNEQTSILDSWPTGPAGSGTNIIHTPLLQEPRYDLGEEDIMGWIQGRQQRKCTLCLEALKDPSSTTCGHIFCWACIADWIQEKPECPLCRQNIMAQHVLPLRA